MLKDLLRLQIDLVATRAELGLALTGGRFLEKLTPDGGGRPVVTLPGFLASETTLLRLNRFLNRHGFDAESWGMGRNLGPQGESWNDVIDRLECELGDRVRRLADEHGTPVSLVGQSLGGVYARELAAVMPAEVDRVIMLGSPTLHPYITSNHNRIIALFGYWMGRQSNAEMAGRRGLLHLDPDEPALPCVSVHSPFDGVVDEDSSRIPDYILADANPAAPRENLRVTSSHIGMSVNPWVFLAIADRLVQSRDDWEDFDPYDYFTGSLERLVPLLFPSQDETEQRADISSLAGAS
jgi:pimeloyl-ACP methyl ester carboxylesterase